MKKLKFIPTIQTSAIFFVLFFIVFGLFLGRTIEWFQIGFLMEWMPEFYLHVSNFSLSYLIYVGIGYFWLMMGVHFRFILFLGFFVIISNVIFEYWITVLNTPDVVDSYFGYGGSFLGILFLYYMWKFGMMDNPLAEKADQ